MNLAPQFAPAAFWHLARRMALWSANAYGHYTVRNKSSGASALIELADVMGTGKLDIVVAFKGSSTPRDFLADAEFRLTELIWSQNDRCAEVHFGFLSDFESIDVQVVNEINALLKKNPAAGIYITGHSLGSALAQLCALEFCRLKLPVEAVVTFGGPRVGNATFARIYDGASAYQSTQIFNTLGAITWRVVNQNDIVPRMPWITFGYRHCGTEIFIAPPTAVFRSFSINPPVLFKLLCDLVGFYGAYRNRQDVLIREHFIAAYQARMLNL